MIVRNKKVVNFRNIVGGITVSSFKCFYRKQKGRSVAAKHRVNQDFPAINLNKVGRMTEPHQYIFIISKMKEIGFHRRDIVNR